MGIDVSAGAAPAASLDEQKLIAAHNALMRMREVQHDFAGAPTPPKAPAWVAALVKALEALAPVLKIVFWAAVAAGAVYVVWLIVRDLPIAQRWRRPRPPPRETETWRPEASAARALLEAADDLAQAGQFGEAIHLLLFRSIEDIGARRPEAVRAALTSRDILEAAPLSDAGRSAFRLIALEVERSFFGGQPAGRPEFERCRDQYQAFAQAEAR